MDLKRFQELYKSHKTRSAMLGERASLSKRISASKNHRCSFRNNLMMEKRNIPNGVISPIVTPSISKKTEKVVINTEKDERKEKLLKWQEEKKKRLEKEKKQKRPIFKICHVTHDDDLNKVYGEIKGKLISNTKNEQQIIVAPSRNYKFKPPSNIKPIELNRDIVSGNNKKKMLQTQVRFEVVKTNKAPKPSSQKNAREQNKKQEIIKCNCKGKSSHSDFSKCPQKVKKQEKALATVADDEGSSNRRKGVSKVKSKKDSVVSLLEDPQPSTSRAVRVTRRTKMESMKHSSSSSEDNENGNLQKKNPTTKSLDNVGSSCSKAKKQSLRKSQSKDEKSVPEPSNIENVKEKSSSSLSTDYPLSEENNMSDVSNQPKTPNDKGLPCAADVSPFITVSRGKQNARTEFRNRSTLGATKKSLDNVDSSSSKAKKRSLRKSQSKDEKSVPEPSNIGNVEEKSSSSLSTDYPLSEENNTSDVSSQPKTPNDKGSPCVTYVSPFVTVSRGKQKARREFLNKSIGLEDDNECSSPKAAAAYFYNILNNQINRLQGICQEWNTYKEEKNAPEEVCDMINVAIGQTELLINKKCQQFRELIVMCETGNSDKPVQPLDLHGFWDMITIQINNLDKRFENLQRLKSNGWEEILPLPEVKPNNQQKPTRKVVRKASNKKGVSTLQAFMKERRKAVKTNNDDDEEKLSVINSKKFEGVKAKTPNTDKRRVSTLISSSNRKISSPGLTMMKITQAAKSITPITQSVNTPKSILKSKRKSRSEMKKSKAVLFKNNDSPEKNMNEENDYNILNISPTRIPRRSKRLSQK